MSRMKSFSHASSRKEPPSPIPLGIVRCSMNSINWAARRLPCAVRLTGEEARELAGAFAIAAAMAGGNACPGDWGESKFGGITDHVCGCAIRDLHERILNRVVEG